MEGSSAAHLSEAINQTQLTKLNQDIKSQSAMMINEKSMQGLVGKRNTRDGLLSPIKRSRSRDRSSGMS